MATIVTNKTELERALKAKQFPIKVTGNYAIQLSKKYHKTKKVKKAAIVGGVATVIASAAALPFTGGASAAGVAAGLSVAGFTAGAATLTAGAVTLTAGELAILCGFTLGMTGIVGGLIANRKLKVKFGQTEVDISEKA